MPTNIGKIGENLAETLFIGNYTANGQKIRALNGTSSLNLRFSVDNEIVLTNDDVTFLAALLYLSPSALQMSFGQNFYVECTALASAFRTSGAIGYIKMNIGALEHLDISNYSISEVSALKIIDNLIDRLGVAPDNATSFLLSGSGINPSTIKANVKRSPCVGGEGLTAKTDNTPYLNQLSLQAPGVLFDCIIKPGTITADRIITAPDQSGEIMLNKYQEKWTLYNATLNAAWETIVIADALPNSTIEVTCENNTAANRDMGVRQVGSVLNRFVTATTRSATSFMVRTNSLKQIQVYASVAADISFNFSAQI